MELLRSIYSIGAENPQLLPRWQADLSLPNNESPKNQNHAALRALFMPAYFTTFTMTATS